MQCKYNMDLHNIFEDCLVQVVSAEGHKTVSTTHVAEGIFWKAAASVVTAQGEMEKIFLLQSKLYFQWLFLRQKGVLVRWAHGCSDSCSWSWAIFVFNRMLLDVYGFCMFSIVALLHFCTARIGTTQLAKLLGLMLLHQFDGLEEQLLKGLSKPSWLRCNQAPPEVSSLIKEKWLGNSTMSVPWLSVCKTRMMVSPLSCRGVVKIHHIKGDLRGARRLVGRGATWVPRRARLPCCSF